MSLRLVAAALIIASLPAGALAAPGQACGTRGTGNCPGGEFCSFSLRANCGYTDAGGRCARIPKACTRDYRPVCGCNRKSYANECMANAAGVSVLHAGRCKG